LKSGNVPACKRKGSHYCGLKSKAAAPCGKRQQVTPRINAKTEDYIFGQRCISQYFAQKKKLILVGLQI